MESVYDVLNFMTGDTLFTHQLPRARGECKPYLLKQFPQLATPEMESEVAELVEMLKTTSDEDENDKLVAEWLAKQVTRYGEYLLVEQIPMDDHTVKDPAEELAEMMPGKPIIVVRT